MRTAQNIPNVRIAGKTLNELEANDAIVERLVVSITFPDIRMV